MITINGRIFVQNRKEETKLAPGEVATGYYRTLQGGILLMDSQRGPRAAVVGTSHFLGIVNCGRGEKGRLFFQYALGNFEAAWLGIDPDNREAISTAAKDALAQAVAEVRNAADKARADGPCSGASASSGPFGEDEEETCGPNP